MQTHTGAGERPDELIERIGEFLHADVEPLEARLLGAGWEALLPELERLREQVRAMGLWAPFLPVAQGGMGLSLGEFAHVSEALGRSPLGHYLFNCQAPDVGNMELLLGHGSPEQRKRYLEPLCAGYIRSCFAMTEPEHAGSNPVWMSTSAIQDGDSWVINGHKWFTTAADGAAFTIVMAVTDPDAQKPHARASMILVPSDTPGYRLVRNLPFMGEAGAGWLSHAEVVFENCRVPLANLVGRRGHGFALAQERLGPGRIHHCMRWVGICERAFDLMCRRAASRELAPGKPLASRQVVQHWIAECRAQINAARLMVIDAAQAIDRRGPAGARIEISLIKFFVAGVLQQVLDRAIQVHGALGLTEETPLAFWYRHERGARIYDGADEVHKSVVARQILKGYGTEIDM